MMISELEFCAVWNRANLANWENENKKSYSKLWEKEVLNIYALYLYIYSYKCTNKPYSADLVWTLESLLCELKGRSSKVVLC